MLQPLLLASLAAVAAHAQPMPATSGPWPAPVIAPLAAAPGLSGEDVMTFVSSQLGGRAVVKGAPYSATAVTETRQVLADGNRIVRTTSSRIYRDGAGRTRQEQVRGIVFVNDVVAGKRLLLNTENKTARELPMRPVPPVPPVAPVPPVSGAEPPAPPAPPGAMTGDDVHGWAESMRQWARDFSARMRGDGAGVERDVSVIVRREGEGTRAPEAIHQRVDVVRLADAQAPLPLSLPLLPPPGPGVRTALGTRDFDGVRADGTRTSWTIPAGQIGNEKPIEIVSERWYSPELMLVVHARYSDPRSGERIYRVQDIRRDEPAADLFRVPADYHMRAAPGRPGIR